MSFRELLEGLYQPDKPRTVLGFVELRARRPDGTIEGRWCPSIDDAIVASETLGKLADATHTSVYYGINPRSRKEGTNDSVKYVLSVAADIDFDKQSNQHKYPEDYLIEFGLYPSALVSTGHGVHAYWFLEEPVEASEEFKSERKSFIKMGGSDPIQDEARVLRVPGTRNYKDVEPTTVDLLFCNASRRYPGSVFHKVVLLSPRVRRVLFTGAVTGFRSRSERDWTIIREMVECGFNDEEIHTVISHSKANKRYVERWPSLLRFDIERAREMLSLGEGTAGAVEITENGNCYWRRVEGGTKKLSTFVLHPVALMQGSTIEEDRILCNVTAEGSHETWKDVQLPRSAFTDRRSLVKYMPVAAWSWLGTDSELTHLLPYLIKYIQNADVPTVKTVQALGRNGTSWITEVDVITASAVRDFADAGFMYLAKNHVRPTLDFTIDDSIEEKVRKLSRILPNINKPQVIWPILGWLFASFYKPVLHPQGRMFPILQVIGSRGAGKTSIVSNVLLPIIGYESPEGYSCDTTDFVVLTLLGLSTTTPVYFGEYRNSLPNADRFLRRLRLSYDSGTDARGRGDQSTVAYPIISPIIIDGENPADEPAILERSVIVTLSQEDLNDTRRSMYKDAVDLLPYNTAGGIVQYSLQNPPAISEARKIIEEAFRGRSVPDRIMNNFQVVTTGLLAYKGFTSRYEAFCPQITPKFVRTVLENSLTQVTLGDTGRTKIMVDEFVEDIINQIIRTGAGNSSKQGSVYSTQPFVWYYDYKTNNLSFQLTSALNWWAHFRRQRGMTYLSVSTAKMQLRERIPHNNGIDEPTGQYMRGLDARYVSGVGTVQLYTLNVQAVRESGLDVPETLEQLTGFTVKVNLN